MKKLMITQKPHTVFGFVYGSTQRIVGLKFVMEFSYLEKRKEGSPLHPLAEDTPKRAT